eukprot:gene35151-58050_t
MGKPHGEEFLAQPPQLPQTPGHATHLPPGVYRSHLGRMVVTETMRAAAEGSAISPSPAGQASDLCAQLRGPMHVKLAVDRALLSAQC